MSFTPSRGCRRPVAAASAALAGAGLLALTGMATLTGCDSAPPAQDRADYTTALDRYYEGRPMCVWPHGVTFPVEVGRPDRTDLDPRGFAALATAGLLIREHPAKGAAPGMQVYDLTPEGRSALDLDLSQPDSGNFCYGRRTVTSIDNDRKHSTTTELIEYQYHVAQPAAWAREISIQRAFPPVAEELAGTHKAEAILLDTTEGWEVSGTPATVMPPNAVPPPTTLAKTKALLHLGPA